MKHPHPRLARLRAAVHSRAVRTVLATGALALAISALPMLALRLTDIGLLTAPHARTQATGALSPKGDDLYLVRALAQRSRQAGSTQEPLYGEVDMGYNGQMLMASYLDEMRAAGVLSEALGVPLVDGLEADDAYQCTYQADTAGFLTLALTQQQTNSRLCELTVESRTGKVVSARLCLINAGPVGAAGAKADMLRAYCEYLGLDMLEDWAPCSGTSYGEDAVYSRDGEVLLAAGTVQDDTLGDRYLLLNARVLPADTYAQMEQAFDAMQASGGALAACAGLQKLDGGPQPLDETRCMLPVNAGAGVLLTVLDKAAMQQGVLCGRPGCAHSAKSECPALVQSSLGAFARGGRVYDLQYALPVEGVDSAPSLVLRGMTQGLTGWEELARVSLAPYEACGQMEWYAGEDMLYLFLTSEARGPEAPCALLAVELGGGTPQPVPVSPGTEVLGVWDGLFVCGRTVLPAAVGTLEPYAPYRAAEYSAAATEIFLKSPVTGAEQLVVRAPCLAYGDCAVDGGMLYFTAGELYQNAGDGQVVRQGCTVWGADLRRRAVQPLAALEENEVLDLARACGGWAPLYGARQEWMQLSTTERVLVDAQYTDGYGELRDWQVYGQWGEDMLVVNRAGLLGSGTYWDGYALIPADLFRTGHTEAARPFREGPVLGALAAAREGWW